MKKQFFIKPSERVKEINFVPILSNGSALGLWHRPQTAHIRHIKEVHKVTLVVTIQGERERPLDVKKECEKQKIEWMHLQINGANTGLLRAQSYKFVKAVSKVYQRMVANKEIVMVHCAAGIHRTGVFAYSLLRATGLSGKGAMTKILELREVTHRGVGKDRIEGADLYIIPPLLKAVKDGKMPEEDRKKIEEIKKQDLEEEEQLKRVKLEELMEKRALRAKKKQEEPPEDSPKLALFQDDEQEY